MPRLRRYYGFNHLYFITASTYHRARLFDSDRFRFYFLKDDSLLPMQPCSDRTHRKNRDVCATLPVRFPPGLIYSIARALSA